MAFFRKVAEANETLFVPDSGKSSSTFALPAMTRKGSDVQSVVEDDMSVDEEDRFNESGMANKRRRLSPSSTAGMRLQRNMITASDRLWVL